MINIDELDFDKGGGLIPAIITDNYSKEVLMLGYMNYEALVKTLREKRVTFFSRTKQRLWTKGETSGNFLDLVEIKSDCDNDTLLIKVEPKGNTCHLDSYSCFGEERFEAGFLSYLQNFIDTRKKEMPEGSYTTQLFNSGENRIIQKVGEEAIETVIAAKNSDKDELVNEASDLFYHLIVLFSEKGLSINQILENLKNRHKV